MMLSAKEYAQKHGLSHSRVKYLAKKRRLEGAIKRRESGRWEIPEDARVLPPREGRGRRHHKYPDSYSGLSAADVAAREGLTQARIGQLLRGGRIEGAAKGPRGWDIPADYKILPPKPKVREDIKIAG
jgi:hypothetical protein